MNIAIIGWGSQIWCPGSLKVKTKWRSDGPELPIEFARISSDKRLTLVIHLGCEDQRTYWALSGFEDLENARRNLKERDGTNLEHVHYLTADGQAAEGVRHGVNRRVQAWLAARRAEVGAAVWTGLETNWREKRGCDFSPDDAIRYLTELESERDRAQATHDRARE